MLDLLPSAIALLAVCVSAYAVWESKRTQLNAAYFAEKTRSYENFLSCASEFVFEQSWKTKNDLAAAVYQLRLFAPAEIETQAREYYTALLEASNLRELVPGKSQWADEALEEIASAMRTDLASFRRR